MNEKELKSIEIEVLYQISIKNNFWNAMVLSIAGTIGLVLSGLNCLKIFLVLIGIILIIIFVFGYFKRMNNIETLIKKTKEEK